MLTFFEYLRQRAFESVLSGAQEALELLSRDKTFGADKANGAREQTQLAVDRESDVVATGEGSPMNPPMDSSNLPANSASVPAPRRRGRPKKKAASER